MIRAYAVTPSGGRWFVHARTWSGGFKMGYFARLQDAYAWLFGLGAFGPAPAPFDNHDISGAKEEP